MLPARELLLVEREKILDYLLNLDHRYGASKARFFGAFGFRRDAWEVLRDALCEHGRRPPICTVWQLDANQTAPRLITAYPSEAS
jgi:hypothetical protein